MDMLGDHLTQQQRSGMTLVTLLTVWSGPDDSAGDLSPTPLMEKEC